MDREREHKIDEIINKHERRKGWDTQDFFHSDVENCMIEFSEWENKELKQQIQSLQKENEILILEKEIDRVHNSYSMWLMPDERIKLDNRLSELEAKLKELKGE